MGLPVDGRDHAERGYPEPVPVLLLLLTMVIAVLVWRFAAARKTGASPLRPRFVGPDDDPDFLRELDRRSRRPDDQP